MTLPYTPTLIVNTEIQPTTTVYPCMKDPILTQRTRCTNCCNLHCHIPVP